MPEPVTTTGGAVAHQRRRPVVALLAAALLSACSAPTPAAEPQDHDHDHEMPATPSAPPEATDSGGYAVDGLAVGETVTFRITGPGGRAVTRYQPYESKLLELYVIRTDLSGYRMLDPAMREDGTWIARLEPALRPGTYRAFTTFAAPDASQGPPSHYTLSQPFTVPGDAVDEPPPAGGTTTTVDGYAVTLTGQPKLGERSPLGIGVTRDGKPVGHVDRFLDGYAHLTAFHAGDLAFGRFLSTGKDNAGRLTADAVFPESGTWRLFAQFEVDGQAHVAAFTVVVPAP
ncbi:hypothetical protein GCM10029964_068040 [Kibdelosporangium lantanae]